MKNPPSDPVAILLRSVMTLSRRLRSARPPGSLSHSGLGILGVLHRQGTLVAIRLAELEHLRPQSLTRLLIDLERMKLVKRTRSTIDRREVEITITEKGRQSLIDDLKCRRDSLQVLLATALTETERAQLLSASPVLLKLASHQRLEES